MFAWDVKTGFEFLTEMENDGRLTSVGVFDEDTRILYTPNGRPAFEGGDGVTDYWAALRALGIEVRRISSYEV